MATEVPWFLQHAAAVRHTWAGRGLAAGLAVLFVLLVLTGAVLVLGRSHGHVGPADDGRQADDNALAELGALAALLFGDLRRRSPTIAGAFDRCFRPIVFAGAILRRRLPGVAVWLDPSGHWWRFCVLVAGALGVVAAAVHGVTEGGLDGGSLHELGASLLAGGALVAIEGGAVIVSALLLGSFLGLAPRTPSGDRRFPA